MRNAFLCSVTGVLLSAGGVLAGECGPCGPLPTEVMAPVTLFRQPPPPEPVHAPTTPFPGVVIYRREPLPPKWTHAPPSPPVQLFRVPTPPVALMRLTPPPVPLFRKEAAPPVWTEGRPVNPVVVFRGEPLPPRYGPTEVFPGPTIFHKPQPPAPCPPPDCGHLGGEGPLPSEDVVGGGHGL
jgi:hypothetical protein